MKQVNLARGTLLVYSPVGTSALVQAALWKAIRTRWQWSRTVTATT